MTAETFTGWACVDCLMILANGEDSPEWTAEESAAHHTAMDKQCDGCEVTLGLPRYEHDRDCPWYSDNGPCTWGCETQEFSWSSCDTCGSHLGGSRDAVTFWPVKVTS